MKTELSAVLSKNNFRFDKRFGQNFITDGNLLSAIVSDAGVTKDDTVVEIGAGAGTLTAAIAERAKKVIAFEIDGNLKPVLSETLAKFENVEVIFGDFLKIGADTLKGLKDFKVVANLPYYITTPVVMEILENFRPQTVSIMVQKEVAERFCAKPASAEYGAVTLGIKIHGEACVTRNVSRKMFFPEPNVDSAVVRIDCAEKFDEATAAGIKKIVKAAFSMRRKTLVNNLAAAGAEKSAVAVALEKLGLRSDVRGETLGLPDFEKLHRILNV